ncbi:ubiquitin carboxyl-terminal hydrolase 17-like protein C isoform X2 [Polypterus senegalus]|uniref:ubiquitin carboxyl-terminal hydrolase 17-like protein C isoform X2 n=1 Tax=Polypterus senegalus TaxID=55291 RepID=UPI00196277D9|nr:ubiquitin carboxyl-terminal hydrolase 17-like protein C isoform X2 [Polypterus senegalus]
MWLFHLLWACSAFSLPRLAVVLVLLLLLLLLSVAPVLLSSYFCKRLAMASRRDKTKRDKASADSSSPPGFRGLYNQGSTCYLNTVLQTLFMTPAFRHAIYRLGANCSDTKPIILELKKLFEELQFGKQSVSTRGITKSLGITDVWVQRDAEEYFQKILTQVGGEILEIYQSCVLSITTCGRCQTSQQESNTYLSIPLALNPGIAGCYSVENGLEQFLITEHLRGENQIYCDNCEVKTDAEIKLCFQCMPKILTLQLKRFEFDWIQMCHVKNQRAVEIPEILKFTQDGTVWSFKKDSAQNSVVYELFAIFHHSGGYRGGHYTADVRLHETEDWYSFDDSCVYLQNNKKTKHKQRSHTAYVLMYRRGDTEILQTEDIPIDESSGITNNSQNSKKKKTESPPFTQGNNGDIEHERKKRANVKVAGFQEGMRSQQSPETEDFSSSPSTSSYSLKSINHDIHEVHQDTALRNVGTDRKEQEQGLDFHACYTPSYDKKNKPSNPKSNTKTKCNLIENSGLKKKIPDINGDCGDMCKITFPYFPKKRQARGCPMPQPVNKVRSISECSRVLKGRDSTKFLRNQRKLKRTAKYRQQLSRNPICFQKGQSKESRSSAIKTNKRGKKSKSLHSRSGHVENCESELNRNDTEDCAALKKHQELSSSSVASQLLNRTEDGDFSKSNSAGFVKDMENLNLEQSSSGMSETRTPPRVDLVDPLAETMGNKEAAQRSEEASDGHHDNASIENTDIGKCAL